MATSFPYLAVAKQYGVDYRRVLQFAELLDDAPPTQSSWNLSRLWMVATCAAYMNEQNRRMAQAPEDEFNVVIKVRGNCGLVHNSIEEWQKCLACGNPPMVQWSAILDPTSWEPDPTTGSHKL